MDSLYSSSSAIGSLKSPGSDSSSVSRNSFTCFSGSGQKVGLAMDNKAKILLGDNGYVLEDVPHFSDYIPNLPVCVINSRQKIDALLCLLFLFVNCSNGFLFGVL